MAITSLTGYKGIAEILGVTREVEFDENKLTIHGVNLEDTNELIGFLALNQVVGKQPGGGRIKAMDVVLSAKQEEPEPEKEKEAPKPAPKPSKKPSDPPTEAVAEEAAPSKDTDTDKEEEKEEKKPPRKRRGRPPKKAKEEPKPPPPPPEEPDEDDDFKDEDDDSDEDFDDEETGEVEKEEEEDEEEEEEEEEEKEEEPEPPKKTRGRPKGRPKGSKGKGKKAKAKKEDEDKDSWDLEGDTSAGQGIAGVSDALLAQVGEKNSIRDLLQLFVDDGVTDLKTLIEIFEDLKKDKVAEKALRNLKVEHIPDRITRIANSVEGIVGTDEDD